MQNLSGLVAVLGLTLCAACGGGDSGDGSNGGSSTTGNGGSSAANGGSSTTGNGGSSTANGGATSSSGGSTSTTTTHFSFFVTSVGAMKTLSGNAQGFGGDLRFGETGTGAGLRGADKICTTIAEMALPGSGSKGWRAFLSAKSAGSGGAVVHAKDRIGAGPWYDRMGRLVSQNLTNLLQRRPTDADAAIINDLPNENGIPNHSDGASGCTGNACPDNHDTLTGCAADGSLYTQTTNPTCDDWTTVVGSAGKPRVGHSWPRTTTGGGSGGGNDMANWMSALDEAGCAAGINLVEMGPPNAANPTVGSGGGYGGIYCFALSP
ncbi:MAG: hypothetical protein QM756_40815 [Polyangiaceae bacterium]